MPSWKAATSSGGSRSSTARSSISSSVLGTARQPAEHLDGVELLDVLQTQEVTRQHQAPGRSIDEHRIAGTKMFLPARRSELIGDQPVCRRRVGDTQQSFGYAHQQHALLRGQIVLLHEGVDTSLVDRLPADGAHKIVFRKLL